MPDDGQAERLGRSLGEIDDAPMGEGAAIVDPHHDGAAVRLVDDPEPRAERQEAMGGRHVDRS